MLLELRKAGRSKTFLQCTYVSEKQAHGYAQGAQAELLDGLLRILAGTMLKASGWRCEAPSLQTYPRLAVMSNEPAGMVSSILG